MNLATTAAERMVDEQLIPRGISSARLLQLMREVPRHRFVDQDLDQAYGDFPLPIGFGQTISQPYIVAAMVELCEIKGSDRCLEVGAGSGYQSAIVAQLCRHLYAIERIEALAQRARAALSALQLKNVTVVTGDGSVGLAEQAPFDVIIVAAAAPAVPQPLKEQLSEGGRLVIPVGAREHQTLLRIVRQGHDWATERHLPCRFVGLLGAHGWA